MIRREGISHYANSLLYPKIPNSVHPVDPVYRVNYPFVSTFPSVITNSQIILPLQVGESFTGFFPKAFHLSSSLTDLSRPMLQDQNLDHELSELHDKRSACVTVQLRGVNGKVGGEEM